MKDRTRLLLEQQLQRLPNDTAREYMAAVVELRTDAAKEVIRTQVRSQLDLRAVYLSVFVPVQECVAALRTDTAITVIEEQFMTMTTQELLDELSSLVLSPGAGTGPVIVCTPPNELDDTRARIIADVLEIDGIDTHFISCPRDADEVIEAHAATPAPLLILPMGRDDQICGAGPFFRDLKRRLDSATLIVDRRIGPCFAGGGNGPATDVFDTAGEAVALAHRRLGMAGGRGQ